MGSRKKAQHFYGKRSRKRYASAELISFPEKIFIKQTEKSLDTFRIVVIIRYAVFDGDIEV